MQNISSEMKVDQAVKVSLSAQARSSQSESQRAADGGNAGGTQTAKQADFSEPSVSVNINGEEKNTEQEKDKRDITPEDAEEMSAMLNAFMEKLNCGIQFKYHKELDLMAIQMINKRTKEVIKEFPPEKLLEAMEKTQEWIGVFLDKKA